MPIEDDNTVSFRLPPDISQKLIELASASDISKHKAARMLVICALQVAPRQDEPDQDAPDPLASVEDAFAALSANIGDLRMGLGRGIGAILQQVAPDMDKEDIRKWIFEKIISPSTRAREDGAEEC